MRNSFIYILFIASALAASCGSNYKKSMQETVRLDEYTGYVFRLCETRNTYGNKRFFLCDTPCTATDVQANDDIQVVEELYAFQSNNDPERIIYFTSRSDKSLKEDRGVFNDSLYQKYIFVSDFEYVYFGSMTNNIEINFINAKSELAFQLKPVAEDCRFVVDSIHSITDEKNSISNKKISLNELFSVPLQFIRTERKIAYKRSNPQLITTLSLTGTKMLFQGETEVHALSQGRRLQYHPDFRQAQRDTLKSFIDLSQRKNP